ncbi:FAD/NAD(P)-binding protein [Novosphingobium resinovorum]
MISHNAARDLPIAIVGGGFSGTLLAINLLRYGVKVALIERNSAQLAKGVAFGTRRPEHLLNVRASNMSAFPDDAKHFARWMDFADADEANRFVPRLTYGTYLRELLVEALAKAGPDAQVIDGEACSVDFGDGAAHVRLADGDVVDCRAVVLALGNFPPAPHGVLEGLPGHLYSPDPWDRSAIEGLAALDHVLVVGSGLTAADVVLSLESSGFGGKVTVLSRRGSSRSPTPRAGRWWFPFPTPICAARTSSGPSGAGRRRSAGAARWMLCDPTPRTSGAAIRPPRRPAFCGICGHIGTFTATASPLGRAAAGSDGERRAAAVRGWQTVRSRRSRRAGGGALSPAWSGRHRGDRGGPRVQLRRAGRRLAPGGGAGPDASARGGTYSRRRPRPWGGRRPSRPGARCRWHCAGPPARGRADHQGEAWEIVAVPDIRRQVWGLARFLADEHWVGGEGL